LIDTETRIKMKNYSDTKDMAHNMFHLTTSGLESAFENSIEVHVDQSKFDLKELTDSGYMLMDMHVHTRFSDSYSKVSKLLERARRLGIGMAITDHNEIRGVERAYEIKGRTPIIPGIEISTYEGPHVLVYFSNIRSLRYFYYRYVQRHKTANPHTNTTLTIPELMKAARHYDCLVTVAHPFSLAYTHLPRNIERGYISPDFLDQVDAIEVLNGAVTRKRNRQAIEFASQLGKAFTGGSDSHSIFELGKIITYAKARTIRDFLMQVRNRTCSVVGTPTPQLLRVPSLAKSSRKHLIHFFPSLHQRYEQMIARPVRYRAPILAEKLHQLKTEGIELLKNPFL
jgi:predicted metal-dependent phosphoesterase TrpH